MEKDIETKTISKDEEKATEKVVETPKKEEKVKEKKEVKAEEKKTEIKEDVKKKKEIPKVKKEKAVVNAKSLGISTKHSAAVCKFIKNKKIERAISDLEDVLKFKKAIPMKGEIAHKKGKRMSSGKYPKKTVEHFIRLVKSLGANANYNGIENPVIVEAVANKASRPYGRFGRTQKKRSHIKLTAKEKKIINKNKKEENKIRREYK